ncbi:MAG: 16S rRNA (adenine(1518)-N(6)/adenine(1519)-N(6))-dimethyltransferase RsmA [Firmicutes bacterium]|nr:16S rRNA (adenine(1518)-N(6)/adenine(1519)-N(6))-dimethyltransferase RsmA [Bacillota bacterium]
MDLYSPQVIKAIKQKFGFKNSKSLGQNFLTDPDVIRAIIEGAEISESDLVIEVGPGFGVLTDEAAKHAGKVIAIELDKDLLPVLDFTLAGHTNVEIINEDVLKIDLNNLIEGELGSTPVEHAATEAFGSTRSAERGGKLTNVKIIGNLPYYITTPILMKLLESKVNAESIIVMMQKEVAERILAEPGGKEYGALTVAVQYRTITETVAEVPKESFFPAPKVDSQVLKLTLREKPAVKPIDEDLFFRMVKAGFSQRRKTILNSLSTSGLPKEEIAACLDAVKIDNKRRAETLSLQDFCSIADYFSRKRD